MTLPSRPLGKFQDSVSTAIAFMLLSTLLLSIMQALVRHLGQDMHAFQITFLRSVTGVLFMLPFMIRNGQSLLVTRRPGMHALRSALLAFSTFAFFYGLSVVPLAEATVLSLVGVLFGSVAAVIFLGEPMHRRRWLASIMGFAGVLIILRPGFVSPSFGAYAILLSSLTWGLALVVVKELSRTDSPATIIGWSVILMSMISLVFAVPVWRWPTSMEWILGGLIGATATAGHFAMTKSLQLADATIVLPLNFTRLIWAILIGFVVFAEVPDLPTLAGAVLICACVVYVSRGEPPAAK